MTIKELTEARARDLTLEAAGTARTVNTRPSNRDLPFSQVKKLLDSRNDREILDGLRKVITVRKVCNFSFFTILTGSLYR